VQKVRPSAQNQTGFLLPKGLDNCGVLVRNRCEAIRIPIRTPDAIRRVDHAQSVGQTLLPAHALLTRLRLS
jgi:hypothetical protein